MTWEPAPGFCRCGKKLETSLAGSLVTGYDSQGNIIYEVCFHGVIVRDERGIQTRATA